MTKTRICYVYAYLDTRRPGKFEYQTVCFLFEPIYVGKGHGSRMFAHMRPGTRSHLAHKIRRIEAATSAPVLVIKCADLLSDGDALLYERELISSIGRIDRGCGPLINKTDGGDGNCGAIRTEEQRRLISAQLTGRTQSPETRAKRSRAMTGHKVSSETRAKIRLANSGRQLRGKGWTHNEDTRFKMSKPKTAAAVANMTAARRLRVGPVADEVKAKISATLRGRSLSEATKAKMRGRVPWNKGHRT